MKKPKAILFDLGGTVLKLESFDRKAGTERLLELASDPGKATMGEVMELATWLQADIEPYLDSSHLEFSCQNFQKILYDWLNIQFDLSPAEIEMEFWKATAQYSLISGIEKVLDTVNGYRIPMGIISNSAFCSKVLTWELQQKGLDKWFRFIMSSADYGIKKPHPFIFLIAASKLSADPADIWYVGDSLRWDVAGASSVGMESVWYNPDRKPPGEIKASFEINDWPEFIKILDNLCGKDEKSVE